MAFIANFLLSMIVFLLNVSMLYSGYYLYFRNWDFADYRLIHFAILLIMINSIFIHLTLDIDSIKNENVKAMSAEIRECAILIVRGIFACVSLIIIYLCQPGFLWK